MLLRVCTQAEYGFLDKTTSRVQRDDKRAMSLNTNNDGSILRPSHTADRVAPGLPPNKASEHLD